MWKLYLGMFLAVYGIFLGVMGYLKNAFIIKMVKLKFGKNMSDETALKVLYVAAVVVAVIGVVLMFMN